MIRWEPPGPYEVAFSTRVGGVSEGPYDSLNLGRMTGDDVERVDENRRRLCAAVGADARPARAQPPGALDARPPRRAGRARRAGRRALDGRARPADARDDRRLPADRARRATATASPAVAVLHAGWRGLLGGRRRGGRAGARRPAAAAIGPAIGPCCYEVGSEVAEPFAARVRPGRPARPEPRPLDRGRAGAARGGRRARSSASTSAPRAIRSSSSRTAGPASRAACRA